MQPPHKSLVVAMELALPLLKLVIILVEVHVHDCHKIGNIGKN
jgi:hypothetical protein